MSQAPPPAQPQINQPPPRSASSATRELDDLMASLSDFQVGVREKNDDKGTGGVVGGGTRRVGGRRGIGEGRGKDEGRDKVT